MAIARVTGGPLLFTVAVGTGTEDKTIPGTLQQGDWVLVALVSDDPGGGPTGTPMTITTAGYTDIFHHRSSIHCRLAYKFMGATPDTIVTIQQAVSPDWPICGFILVLRGVDTTTPLDGVTPTVIDSQTGTGMPDPPSITPATNGAEVCIIGALDDDPVAASVTAPANYSGIIAHQVNPGANGNSTVMFAQRTLATAAAEDPGVFGGTGSDVWFAGTFVLRPAAEPPPPSGHRQGIVMVI